MIPNIPVVVHLQLPKERIWGILVSLDERGVSVRGIDLNSFDDWSRLVANGELSIGLSNVFYPMHRVERVVQDERVGEIEAFHDSFRARVGLDVWSHLGIERPTAVSSPSPGDFEA